MYWLTRQFVFSKASRSSRLISNSLRASLKASLRSLLSYSVWFRMQPKSKSSETTGLYAAVTGRVSAYLKRANKEAS